MILNNGRLYTAYMMTGSYTGSQYFMVGSGGTAVDESDTTLDHPRSRQLFTSRGVTAGSTVKIAFIGDWTAAQISGTILREFGLTGSQAGVTGSIWSRSVINPITFNGTNELRIEENWEFY
jgi:hypothetical protein